MNYFRLKISILQNIRALFFVFPMLLVGVSGSQAWAAGKAMKSPKKSTASAESDSSNEFRMTYDLSGSLGSAYGRGYQEISLGVNAYFFEWFAWRNSGFARFVEGNDSVYGLDTSARFILNLGDRKLGFTAFAGPGYRFATGGGRLPADSAPFAEAGVVAKLGGLSIGGGTKTVFNNLVRSGAASDTQYFLILAGGGSL